MTINSEISRFFEEIRSLQGMAITAKAIENHLN